MKKSLVSAALALLLLASCDVIDDPIIPNNNAFRIDLYDAPTFEANTSTDKNILLEEFTGHFCGNCPGAALTADDLAEDERVVLMSVHAGGLAQPNADFTADFTTPEADTWWDQMTSPNLPGARIDRRATQSDWFLAPEWEEQVINALAVPAEARVQILTEWVAENNHLNIHVESEFLADLDGTYRLAVYVLESEIVSPQLNYAVTGNPEYPSPTAYDYIHEHTFRTSVNGTDGVTLLSDPVAGDVVVKSYTFPWNSNWSLEHSEIVAVITRSGTGEIMNVAHVNL